MKLVTFQAEHSRHLGVLADDETRVIDLTAARPNTSYMRDVLAFLEAGEPALKAAKNLAAAPDNQPTVDLADATLCAPVPCPRKLFCLAGNYREHLEEFGADDIGDMQAPRVFMKPPSTTVIGPKMPICLPPVARAIDWEGELAVIIGRQAKAVPMERALAFVAGYTIMNDVSERDFEVWPREEAKPRDKWFDWLNGKWFDTFAPQGPCLVTRDEVPDPQALNITTRVNGETKQQSHTSRMLVPVAGVIAFISAYVTLEPGDVISTGTIAGVGAASGTYLQPGDQVEIEIDGLGVLRNPVQAAKV